MDKRKVTINIKNKRATFDYVISDTYTAGIVLTGGGAKIKDIVQLTEFITGLDARIGISNEQLSGTITDEMKHPMHATGIGLVLKGFESIDKENLLNGKTDRTDEPIAEKDVVEEETNETDEVSEVEKNKTSFLDSIVNFFRSITSEKND